MATPTAAPATRLRRLSRDAARANKSSSLLGAMAAEARGSPRTRVPVRISRRLCSTTLPRLIPPVTAELFPKPPVRMEVSPVGWAKDSP